MGPRHRSFQRGVALGRPRTDAFWSFWLLWKRKAPCNQKESVRDEQGQVGRKDHATIMRNGHDGNAAKGTGRQLLAGPRIRGDAWKCDSSRVFDRVE